MRSNVLLEILPSEFDTPPRASRSVRGSTIAPVFVDKSLFLYSRSTGDPLRRRLAVEWIELLWRERLGRTSLQVLSEYYATLARRLDPGPARDEAWSDVLNLLVWNPLPTDADLLLRARDLERRHRLSWGDSLVVGAAQLQGCAMLLTDELPPGAIYDGVIIHNPFTFGVAEIAPRYGATRSIRVSDSLALADGTTAHSARRAA
jgi:predicted nucleic acid-binding protein